MTGRIIAIFVAPEHYAEQVAIETVQLKTGKGIVGDRYFGLRPKHPGKNITLIESEIIVEFNRNYHQSISLSAARRNFVTEGIQLNTLVGLTFRLGKVLCRGIELCEPCKVMARNFPATALSHPEIIRALANKGGIRVEVLTDELVRLGDEIFSDIIAMKECGKRNVSSAEYDASRKP
ncbi:MOSC domain-containing protein [Methyloglobulus sp.]|uniref:MOSC domain-containing protein n=1 Tax=Methyloglobulus sp. TaxID=2518622 RepID=UPI0032B80E71